MSINMQMNRRAFLTTSVAAAASCAIASPVRGKAEHVISIWLGGGMGQIDSFDPKRKGLLRIHRHGSTGGSSLRTPGKTRAFDGPRNGRSDGSS